ncbi:hypothetical protein ACH46_12120 [Gordonia phthalatica]|uniref:Uncharacterized protein n=2 Tax=Gordonia phthalatica TaxID=1136941 RepID=A0A0N9MVS7_9ACTN|nr:hypothetical protein ACH46_12120 [Gordonia phthalatica]
MPQPEVRFFLPPGPPLPPKRWQRKWKIGIRLGSLIVGVAFVVGAIGALVFGVISSSYFTASGAVEVDCATRAKPFVTDVAVGSPVTIVDARTGEVYGSSTLGDFTALKSGICLVSFEVEDVPVANLYTVRIGKSFEALATADTLRGGALLR